MLDAAAGGWEKAYDQLDRIMLNFQSALLLLF